MFVTLLLALNVIDLKDLKTVINLIPELTNVPSYQGILALRKDSRFDPSINYFLDRFYTSRIAIRVLISNHCKLWGKALAITTTH